MFTGLLELCYYKVLELFCSMWCGFLQEGKEICGIGVDHMVGNYKHSVLYSILWHFSRAGKLGSSLGGGVLHMRCCNLSLLLVLIKTLIALLHDVEPAIIQDSSQTFCPESFPRAFFP